MTFNEWLELAQPKLSRKDVRDMRVHLVSTRLAVEYVLAARKQPRSRTAYGTISQELIRKRRRKHGDDYVHGAHVIPDLEGWCSET